MFRWSEENLKWYLKAEEATEFYDMIIEIIKVYLKDMKTALDIGCGIGGITLRLAGLDISVTALDTSLMALDALDERLKNKSHKNVTRINGDFEKFVTKEKYDMVIGSYIMGLINESNLDRMLSLANKYLVFVLPTKELKNDFSIDELFCVMNRDSSILKQKTYVEVCELLRRRKIEHNVCFIKGKFNQPLDSLEEGLEFIKFYFNISEYYEKCAMEWLRGKVMKDERGLYLPSYRESAVITIKK